MNCDSIKPLLMGLIDNELTAEERGTVNEHLIRCNNCRKEFEELEDVNKKLSAISFSEPDDKILSSLWKNPLYRISRLTGFFLVIAGNILLLGFGLYKLILDKNESFFYKSVIISIVCGIFILLISIIIERLNTYKNDPYKEVIR